MNENKDKKMKTSTILVLGLVFGGILGSILILIDSLFVILLFLVMIPLSLYYPAKNFQKGKKLSDVRASLLETQMAEIKFFWYFITIIVTILLVALCICKISCIMKCKCILTYESFNCFLYYFYNDILPKL
ncbi:MAG: hypothetical protein KAI55_03185 [Candidatus Aenigmarchaeota archaeon]|nr:hypothetical protein [Candidatus Aenigmarchaeota archaeon]